MKTRVPMVTAAIAAITLALGSCSDSHETLTPTGPSAIGDAAEAPATSRTTASPTTAGVQVNDETSGTGDNWQNTGLNRSYTYIEGVPGTPRHVRVRPTGEKGGGSYEVEVSWEPPNWGATDAHTLMMEVVDGTTVKATATWITRPRITSPATGHVFAAEGRAKVSLCNDVGCGPPWDAGSIVIGDAMEKPGPPEMTIKPAAGIGDKIINGRVFEQNYYTLDLNWRNTDFARKVQLEYWYGRHEGGRRPS